MSANPSSTLKKGGFMNDKRFFVVLSLLLIILLWTTACLTAPISTPEITAVVIAATSALPPTPTPLPTDTPTPLPTSTISPSPVPTPTTLPKDYLVKEGDTLSAIAKLYGIPLAFIILNNGIEDANLIYPGQVLIIPDPGETPTKIAKDGKQIVVILSLQMTYAFADGQLIKEFLVSTGRPDTPTVQGSYAIYDKYKLTRMTGPGYDLPDVPWTMYFYEGYSFHGTYWHNNFGHTMSHGCVNMSIDDAHWLYDWAPLGTHVLILP
jgi:lipoprotein-anchoring transpeptidase ErfK/SrfK